MAALTTMMKGLNPMAALTTMVKGFSNGCTDNNGKQLARQLCS